MSVIKVKRGLAADLPTSGLNIGELLLATDTGDLYICTGASTKVRLANLADVLQISNNLSDLDNNATARTNLDVYSKSEVDALLSGLDWSEAKVASTANLTLSGEQTIDDISVTAGDRVLVKDQTDATENGIYVCASGSWSRATDADTGTEIESAAVIINYGTENGDTAWICTTNSITLGTTDIEFIQFPGSGNIVAGTALDKTGNTISLDLTKLSGTVADPTNNDYFVIYDTINSEHKKVTKQALLADVTAELGKVKFDSDDPLAGYLNDKLQGGDGIDLEEAVAGNIVKINFKMSEYAVDTNNADADADQVLVRDGGTGGLNRKSVNDLIGAATIDGGSF